jgi:SlyX protein
LESLIVDGELEKQVFGALFTAQSTLQECLQRWPSIQGYLQFGGDYRRGVASTVGTRTSYTVWMNSEAIEQIETKIAFLESANLELSDVIYRQQQEIRALRARLDALAQRFEAAQTPETARTLEEERPPHY